ncbi:MAG: ABC transporter permease [Bacteroidetes bacterium]|nr:ABC transporter permease [Bacteroidota bacterium]
MWRYVLKRLLWFIPTLLAVTVIGFMLLANAPGDPVNNLVMSSGSGGSLKTAEDIEVQKTFWRHKLGLDLPVFYFSIGKLSEPDTLYKITDQEQLQRIKANVKIHGGYKNYIPKFNWYGIHNQYHRWLFGGTNTQGIIRGDFGLSISKKEPVMMILKDKLIWSLFFSILSIILAYIISIPIGIKLAQQPESRVSKVTQTLLFLLYSMPSFFVGVLLLMLFANPDVISMFPPSGIKPIEGYDNNASLLSKFSASLPYIILPLICYTYSSLAFISRLTATSIGQQLQQDYIKTATAKGLSQKRILWKHALKNSALPLITVFTSVFPTIIGGSVIIESIFTIPGMGLETVKAIISQDYPVVIAVITLSSVLTIFSYVLADIVYAWIDPRIRPSNEMQNKF